MNLENLKKKVEDDFTFEEKLKLNHKSQLYGTAYAIKHKDGKVEILSQEELVNKYNTIKEIKK